MRCNWTTKRKGLSCMALHQLIEMTRLEMRVQRRSPVWMISLATAGLLSYTEAFTLGVHDWPTTTQAVRAYQLACTMIFGIMTFLLTAGALTRDLSDRRRDLLLSRPISPWVYIGGIYAGNCLFALGISLVLMVIFLAMPLCYGQSTLYEWQPFVTIWCVATLPTILFCGALGALLMCLSRRLIIALPVFLVYFMAVALFRIPMSLYTTQPDVDLWDFSMRLYPHFMSKHIGASSLTDLSYAHLLQPLAPELIVRALLYAGLSLVLAGSSALLLKRMRSH
jgi:ABC-type transport system involved in multi-copper enzyme maturation permease subunit